LDTSTGWENRANVFIPMGATAQIGRVTVVVPRVGSVGPPGTWPGSGGWLGVVGVVVGAVGVPGRVAPGPVVGAVGVVVVVVPPSIKLGAPPIGVSDSFRIVLLTR